MAQRTSSKDTDDPTASERDFEEDIDDDEDVESDDDVSEGDEESEEESQPTKGDLRAQRLSREAARHRMRAKKLRSQLDNANAELAKLKQDGVSDEEGKQLKADSTKLQQENETLKNDIKSLKVGQAIRDGMQDLNLNPKRAKAVIKVIDLDEIDVDEDGEVSGVTEALEAITQEYPEWVISQRDDDDEKANGNGRPSGQSSRKPARKKQEGLDKTRLMQQFPALGRGYLG